MSQYMVLGYPLAGLVPPVTPIGFERADVGAIHCGVSDVVAKFSWTDWSNHELPVSDVSPAYNVYLDDGSKYVLPLSGEVFNIINVEEDSEVVLPSCQTAEKVASHQHSSSSVTKPKSLVEQLLMSDDELAIFSGVDLAGEDTAVVPDCGDNVLDLLTEMGDELGDGVIDYPLDFSDTSPTLPDVSPDDVESILSTFLSSPPCLQSESIYSLSPVASPVYEVPVLSVVAVASPINSISAPYSPESASSPGSIASELSFSSAPSPATTISARFEPYPRIHPEKRARKKEQNKTAALRYRQKKRDEQGSVQSEYDIVERRNAELKSRVEELTKQLSIVRSLVSEILQ